MEFDELYGLLIDQEFFKEETLAVLTSINGARVDVLNDAIYAKFGLRDYEQLKEEYGL